ncbi:hypothetical protein NPIL_233141 [Nephila pilipes]|uniref:Uncharacterized protein n=1 Tax=Nephila pilipes TaxID=299642 RepID=A0A8X6U7Y3_NEPPI|nr:hypothetical protein NPIL_233141 [Nephila pilipes]
MKRRDKLAKRYNVLAKTVDDSAEDLCNNNFTEFELELAISQMKLEGGINRLERFQNNALHLITGAVKTSSIVVVFSYTNEIPMQYEVMKSDIKLYQKLIRLPHSDMWVESGPRKLQTQEGFLQVVLKEMD